MFDKVKNYIEEVKNFTTDKLEDVENLRIKFLSKKKGILTELFKDFKKVPSEEKKEYGKILNELKSLVEQKVKHLKEKIQESKSINIDFDLTLPGYEFNVGRLHPVSKVKKEIVDIFRKMGFVVVDSPELDDDWHNFGALNFPPEHPARDMQDTFFLANGNLLRTHTSNGQIRNMTKRKPPLKILVPGRTYRNEDISARAHVMFHQIEGLYVDKNVSFIDLKQTLLFFAKELFGENTQVRFRPSYFPFTEPSAEVDVTCSLCGGKGCNVCKYTGWLEILGAGMVDPNVLKNVGIDPSEYSGFAFGLGVERIAMLKYGINDIRLMFENDLRFLKQFI